MTRKPAYPINRGSNRPLLRIAAAVFVLYAAQSGLHAQVIAERTFGRASVIAHGGAGSSVGRSGDIVPAVEAAWKALAAGASALDAAIAGAVVLEDAPSFNAGTGSNIRMDGVTVQMDAAVMNERGEFGAVAVIERVKNPVLVAKEVMRSPHLLLAGEGAMRFARKLGMADYDPRTRESIARYRNLRTRMRDLSLGGAWEEFDWQRLWNFPRELQDVLTPSDTVGVVVSDGKGGFGVAISTGGTATTFDGRVGDVPIMGAGVHAGPAGAVCATGWGEYIVREHLSQRVYQWIEEGATPAEAVARGIALYPDKIGIGLVAVSADGIAADSNTSMAWTGIVAGEYHRADDRPPFQPITHGQN